MINAGLLGRSNRDQAFYMRLALTTACRNGFLQAAINANRL